MLDNASRFLLAIIETKRPTTEVSIRVLNEAYKRYSYLRPIQKVIVNHDSHRSTANNRDKKNRAKHRLEMCCEEKGIKLVFTRCNHFADNTRLYFTTSLLFRCFIPLFLIFLQSALSSSEVHRYVQMIVHLPSPFLLNSFLFQL